METRTIIVESIMSPKGNPVWKVSIAGDTSEENTGHFASTLKAIRFCYLLQKRTDAEISQKCLRNLVIIHKATRRKKNKQD